MRLAVFTSHFPGRINTFFARDVRALIDAGVDVELFVIHPLDPALWTFVPACLSERVLPRTRVHHASMFASLGHSLGSRLAWRHAMHATAVTTGAFRFGIAPAAKTAYVIPKAMAWARTHRHRFDHVLAYWGNYAATCAYFFHRAAGAAMPFSTFLHAGTDLYRDPVFLRQKLLYADNIVVVCDFNRQFLRRQYPAIFDQLANKIHLHHLGVDLNELAFAPDGREPNRLIAVGGLHASKGFDDVLRAAAELNRRHVRTSVVIVGDGPERRPLHALAAQLGLTSQVEFLGWQSFDDVREQLRRAALLVHPSTGLGDAVPTVIKEAMALGTPVVASDVAGIPELLDGGACGWLVPPRSPIAIAAAIEVLLADHDRCMTFAHRARQRAVRLFDQTRNGAMLAEQLRRTPPRRSPQRLIQAPAT